IDHEPLRYASAMNIDPAGSAGAAVVDLSLDFPLVADLKLDDLDVRVEAQVADTRVENVAFDLPLERGDLALKLDRTGMDVTGKAELGGIPLDVTWRENFNADPVRS